MSWSLRQYLLPLYTLLLLPLCQAQDLRGELEDLEVARLGISGTQGTIRWLAIHERGVRTGEQWTVGVSCPVLTFGPLSRRGLLREVFNPLGYGARSSVFREETGLVMDSSFRPDARRGLVVTPLPDCLGLFLLERPDAPRKAGIFWRLPPTDFLNLEGIGTTSVPGRGMDGQRWFRPQPLFPGGRLLHLGLRLGIRFPAAKLQLSTLTSSGRRVPPGMVTQLWLEHELSWMFWDLLLGLCSRNYFTPDGGSGKYRLLAAGTLGLRPWQEISFSGSYRRQLVHPPLRAGDYTGGVDTFTLKSEGWWSLAEYFRWGLKAQGSRKIPVMSAGASPVPAKSTRLAAGLCLEWGGLDLDLEWKWEFKERRLAEERQRVGVSLHSKVGRCALELARIRGRKTLYDLSLRLDRKRDRYRIYLKGGFRKPLEGPLWKPFSHRPQRDLTCTLGWEVRD